MTAPALSVARGIAVVILAVALGSCGGSGDTADISRFAVTANAEVAALLGTPLTDADVEAEQEAVHERAEALTALCMASAGFDYIPVAFVSADEVDQDRVLFGVADQFFAVYDDEYVPLVDDPNQPIVDAFSADEQAAYAAALDGAAASFDARFDSIETIRDRAANQTGCRAESVASAIDETDRNSVLIEDYRQLRSGMIATDQRMIRAQFDWVACMTSAGFAYNDTAAIVSDLGREATAVIAELADRGITLSAGETPPPEAIALIDAVYDRERAAANANAECSGPVDDAIAEISDDVDAVFLDRNA